MWASFCGRRETGEGHSGLSRCEEPYLCLVEYSLGAGFMGSGSSEACGPEIPASPERCAVGENAWALEPDRHELDLSQYVTRG